MATPSKRATITVTTTISKQSTKRQKNNRMSLDDFKQYLAILQAQEVQKPSLGLGHNQWSIQEQEQESPKHHANTSSTIEYSAYWSQLDPDEKFDLDSETIASDISSSFIGDKNFYDIKDNNSLKQFGYKINKLLSHTINGCIYVAEIIDSDFNDNKDKERNNIKLPSSPSIKPVKSNLKNVNNINNCLVRVKKYEKENGDRIIQEALILHYLTIKNIPPSPNICKYIDFVETDDAYYLIQEHGEYISLDDLILTAHKYIKMKRMKKKHWRIIIKYLFWQLIATLYWMHELMKVCHLNLSTMNIMVKNAKFIENKQIGIYTIDTRDICIKLCDFGSAEVWQLEQQCQGLKCIKNEFISEVFYKDPKIVNGEMFNPVKADMYSLGMILFKMFTGYLPYKQPEKTDEGYMALKQNGLRKYFKENNFLKGINKYTISLIVGILNFNDKERIMTFDVMTNAWFKSYYQRYKTSFQQKKKSQMERHMKQLDEYKLPYFKLKE
eukprot:229709_1